MEYIVKYKCGGYPCPSYEGVFTVYAFNKNSARYKAVKAILDDTGQKPYKLSIVRGGEYYE